MRKRFIFIILGLVLVSFLLLALTNRGGKVTPTNKPTTISTSTTPANPPSNNQILDPLSSTQQISKLIPSDTRIVSIVEPVSNWFVVTLRASTVADDAKAIYHRDGIGNVSLVIGPGTAFGSSELRSYNVPQAVQDELIIYGDE